MGSNLWTTGGHKKLARPTALCERFNIEKVRARDLWPLTSRTVRKMLFHTVAVFINCLYGREKLQFDGLVDT